MGGGTVPRKGALLAVVAGLAAAWIAFDLLVWAYGQSPRHVLGLLVDGTWGSSYGVGQVLFKATPLLVTGVAVEIGLRAGLFNIGAEGQLAVASVAAAAAGARVPPGTPAPVAVTLVLVVAAAAGAAWAAIPALLKARVGAHEVISTIMMNRVADAVVAFLLAAGLAVPGSVRTADIPACARIPRLDGVAAGLRGSAASWALGLALAIGVLAALARERTRFGRELGWIGMNPVACRAEGVPVARRIAQALVVSGAVAGLASSATVLGYKGYFEEGLGAGAGFGGLAVALLGRGSLPGLVLAALLFGTLQQGGLAVNAYVPKEMMDVLQGVVVCAVALADVRVRRALDAARGAPLGPRREGVA
jgi:simple sugar transport system permease protein